MKKLLFLLLLPLLVNAQTNGTIQKTSATGTIRGSFGSLGLDTLVNVNAPTNGFVPVYNSTLKKSVWTNPSTFSPTLGTSAISLGGTANGLSYSAGNYRLHKVTATTGGVLTTGTDTIAGAKTFTSNPIVSSGSIQLSAPNSSGEAGLLLQTAGVNKWQLFKANSGTNEDFLISNIALGGRTSIGISSTSNAFRINEIPNIGGSSDSILVHDNTSKEVKRVAATTYLTPTGSGSGLSGVVLTSTNQTIGGDKTFSSIISGTAISLTNNINAGGANFFDANGGFAFAPGGTEIASMEVTTGANGYYDFRRNSVSKWNIGLIGSTRPDSYRINNPTTTATSLEINSTTDAASFAGTVSSTPQGTLYGTATGSITSAQLATSLTDETGTGSAVFSASPTFTGTPVVPGYLPLSGGTLTGGLTGTSLNLSGNITGTNASGTTISNNQTGAFTALYGNTGGVFVGTLAGNWISITNAGAIRFPAYGAGTLTTDASGNVTATSDERMKNISGFYTTGLSALANIKPITYKWKAATKLDTKEFYTGFSAQNIHQNIPQAAGKMANGDLTIQDRPIMATMVNAINELHEIIKKQDARILELEKLYLELKK